MKAVTLPQPWPWLAGGDKPDPKNDRGPFDGCWEWTGHRNAWGYGKVRWDGDARLVHRVVFEEVYGPVGDLFVCHRCDNPACFRPDHLFAGTHDDNMADMVQKGRAGQKPRPYCERGHEKTPENTVPGNNNCRICTQARDRARRRGIAVEQELARCGL